MKNAQDKCKSPVGSAPELARELKTINHVSEHGRDEIRERIDVCFTCIIKHFLGALACIDAGRHL